ncbi:MAG: Asp-tRNA(Asn)/Glu-tRNA(Gln) amidotransferase subunit GatA [Caldibacillus debilis]|jgi:aspartyl-tRNA(Asn)/glutamyl-tRNA(Gln) amidotransferase subunit A|uniref:Glutamyl-tRNA(Gln) amidotransferase subunit A n=1 Tax=Caldibacillus debilis TaxID=301148 RepID=A0A3E0K697_9BACI|nr:Asp-tRNA(Asn)/Glu-tRNA(Gln) amidotransferase subunit GatA [Caldibacillus debilis]MBO2481300.1 Asp-tRNA(Asn)/Glu-tRNA(Gln) amidotransferase subunit GatA [Bacillaceae bacterium]MBY6272513.1 Asp-tRNA(Asn)/Glu-tRNA(Gln) amidotransferase subunit GatA [Bacillaceae bacterium]REJ19446.1 MAG: Asp-tRNA(Asn)/Glu-tRNA(Gln) amidotransferase subunit GatA [Caldibacillus debilis]REJ29752.1 MAG: Asp-tRNA(Asn)/Glu-tRNA(Gln) amidotransferase subunit GatA [Caldibacillus debilis]
MAGLFEHKLKDLHEMLVKKEISAADLVDESFRRIREVEDKVQAFITLDEEGARKRAKELDERREEAEVHSLFYGMPIGIKDNIVTKGVLTTCASKILENFIPIYNATVVEKLQNAGTVMIGKLNMDEFAMGSSTENSHFKKTYNPWDLERVPGGSSGGSAAAVAAGEVPFALGSDTGGSIRQPAAFCGVVGMKPTYGRVSRFGLVAFASSLDQIGPITRNVEDNAYLLQLIAGVDPHDSTSADVEVPDYTKAFTGDVKGLKIAVPKEYLGEGVSEESRQAVLAALKVLEKLGAVWEEVSLPHSKYGVACYYLLASSEASSNLARFDGIRYGYRAKDAENLWDLYKKTRAEGFGDEVKRRIMLGTFALSSGYYDAYYKKAQQVRTLIKQDFDRVFEAFDVVIGPTTPTPAFKIGEKIDDPLTMYANDILTIPVNLAGLPAISVPCGFAGHLPLGLQIIGKPFDETTVYRVAHAFEQATDYHRQRPNL